jgi:class 3 adenylate cyclase
LATERVERKLAAILAADVAGYSRLMGADEEGTHERLKTLLRQLVDPKIKEHRGRVVKNTGDGLLAEFSASSMRYAAPPKCSGQWLTAMPRRLRTSASPSGLGSTLAM